MLKILAYGAALLLIGCMLGLYQFIMWMGPGAFFLGYIFLFVLWLFKRPINRSLAAYKAKCRAARLAKEAREMGEG